MHGVPATDWIARGGAYWLVIGGWFVIATVFIVRGFRFGNRPGHEGDGCLLAMAGVVMTLFGGGIGLFAAKYPNFIVTSLFGAITLPLVATSVLVARSKRTDRP